MLKAIIKKLIKRNKKNKTIICDKCNMEFTVNNKLVCWNKDCYLYPKESFNNFL